MWHLDNLPLATGAGDWEAEHHPLRSTIEPIASEFVSALSPLVWSKTRRKILPLKPSRQQECPLNMTMRKGYKDKVRKR